MATDSQFDPSKELVPCCGWQELWWMVDGGWWMWWIKQMQGGYYG